MGDQVRKQGELLQADFFDSTGGLNLTDSPFRVLDNQATSGYNYDLLVTGGVMKRNGHSLLGSADDQLRTLGYALYADLTNTKTLLRAAGSKIQSVNTTSGVCTNLTDDTVSASTAFLSGTQPVVTSGFTTANGVVTWMAGGGLSAPTGYYGSKMTVNGVVAPTSAGTLTFGSASTTGGFLPGGQTFYYAIAYRKLSTQAISNAALDISYAVPAGTNTNQITVTIPTLTNTDTTKYDRIYIYRSNAGGVSGFTIGDLAGTVAIGTTTFVDTGSVFGLATAVPRAGNSSLDNSQLPSGTYNVLTTWKRRLVTAAGSTLYISDLNKPESWPTANYFTIPSPGNITGLAIVSFASPYSATATDEYLVIFKERETWIFTGTSISDWALKFVDYTGCIAQNLAVWANGFLCWIDYRGVYIWDGSGKPVYASRPIESFFGVNGDLDKSNLGIGHGQFFRKQNEITWFLSSSALGVQKLQLKMDLRLTLPRMQDSMDSRVLEGVFMFDQTSFPLYASLATLPNYDETFYAGDASGNTYKLFDNGNGDNGSGFPFAYRTRALDLGFPTTTKRYHKVIVWCRDSTSNNLTLNYWLGYKPDSVNKQSQAARVTNQVSNALWDQASWDAFSWDTYTTNYVPIVYELSGSPIEGEAITLEFEQDDYATPITIAGFSILYSTLGIRKVN